MKYDKHQLAACSLAAGIMLGVAMQGAIRKDYPIMLVSLCIILLQTWLAMRAWKRL